MRAREFANTKLVIFDIDDTLVNTDTKVGVVRDGRVVRQLNSHDFTHYQLRPGESFDFGAFRDAREFFDNAKPIAPMIAQLRHDIATGNKVIMVTARADFDDRDVFLNTFKKYGVDMDRVHVYRAGNIGLKVPTEEKKKMIIRRVMGQDHYDKVIMYDDAEPNLQAFMSLAPEYPWSRFYAWHVDRSGRATEYHRSNIKEATGSSAAGVVLYAEDTGRWGFQQRSDTVNDPGLWAAWGGGREPGESTEQCALRELAEESGYRGPIELEALDQNPDFMTFVGRVPAEFEPRYNPEWKDYCWVEAGDWPQPMHPGMAAALENLGQSQTIVEDNVLHLRDWTVTVSPHALERTYQRGVNTKAVDRILRTLDQIKSNIAGIEPGQPFIIHDRAGTALGMRRLAGNRLTLATVYSIDPDFQRGRYPTFAVSADVNQPLTESLSRVAFHYTGVLAALQIVRSGVFELSSTLGSVEQKYAPRGKPYFLSTTRTRQGGYHRMIGETAVLFVLDGDWFNRHYESRPIDYWENRNPSLPHHRTHEAEDRVFSSEPTIPTGGVTAIHVYVSEDAEPQMRAAARQLLIAAKRQGIATHFYNNKEAWKNFDQRRPASVAQLTGRERTIRRIRPDREYLLPWIELISAQNQGQLSKAADKLRYSLMYDYDRDNAAQGLDNDLSNARKPYAGADRANAVKIIQFMQRNGMTTVKDLVQALSTKWRAEPKKEGQP